MAATIQRKSCGWQSFWKQRLSRQSHEISWEPTRSVHLGEHRFCIQFPQNRNCEICQRTKITKTPVQETQWQSRTLCRKFWWFNYSRSQSCSAKKTNRGTITDLPWRCNTWRNNRTQQYILVQQLILLHPKPWWCINIQTRINIPTGNGSQIDPKWTRPNGPWSWNWPEIFLDQREEKNKATFASPSENWCVPLPEKSSTWSKRLCCRLRSVDAHDQQKGPEWSWNGYFDEIV